MLKRIFFTILVVGCILGSIFCYLSNRYTYGEKYAWKMTWPYVIWYLVIFAVWSFLIYGTGGIFGILE